MLISSAQLEKFLTSDGLRIPFVDSEGACDSALTDRRSAGAPPVSLTVHSATIASEKRADLSLMCRELTRLPRALEGSLAHGEPVTCPSPERTRGAGESHSRRDHQPVRSAILRVAPARWTDKRPTPDDVFSVAGR
jgi:hypothetical protein